MVGSGLSFNRPGELRATLERYLAEGRAGLDATVIELGRVAADAFREELSAKSHGPRTPTPAERGDVPAKITGRLADSVQVRTIFRTQGRLIVHVGPSEFYARFLQNGYYPNGGTRAPRRSVRARKDHIRSGGQQVRFPFVEPVQVKVLASVPIAVKANIRIR